MALFNGDPRYGLTVFGKPSGLEGLIEPENYPLSTDLFRFVGVNFTIYPDIELFRVDRVAGDAGGLTLFSLQTHAISIDSGRAGPFIGAGIFARAGVNPFELVKALREVLHSARAALMSDGRFIVSRIDASVQHLLAIPESVDTVPAPNMPWPTTHSVAQVKHLLITPSTVGVKTAEEFFASVMNVPQAYSSNVFYCEDTRVANDCKLRSNEFDVFANEKVLERHRLAFADLKHKKSEYEQALALKEKNHSQALALAHEHYASQSLQIKDDLKQSHAENSALKDSCTELKNENKKLKLQLRKHDSDSLSGGKIAIIALVALLGVGAIGGIGFSIYKLWPIFFQDSAAKPDAAPRIDKQPTTPPADTSSTKDSNADAPSPSDKK